MQRRNLARLVRAARSPDKADALIEAFRHDKLARRWLEHVGPDRVPANTKQRLTPPLPRSRPARPYHGEPH